MQHTGWFLVGFVIRTGSKRQFGWFVGYDLSSSEWLGYGKNKLFSLVSLFPLQTIIMCVLYQELPCLYPLLNRHFAPEGRAPALFLAEILRTDP